MASSSAADGSRTDASIAAFAARGQGRVGGDALQAGQGEPLEIVQRETLVQQSAGLRLFGVQGAGGVNSSKAAAMPVTATTRRMSA